MEAVKAVFDGRAFVPSSRHEIIKKPQGAATNGMDTGNAPGVSTSNIARFLRKVNSEIKKP
ncbi:MAG: hypothetical protein LBR23_05225 [Spirochaetaceae bacterium]|jgi:hypothetical protein|nr:hypothetical protein [Spirochaetaceae bacterium]